jgi:exodeoxyribonuclease VII large subunit
MVRAEIDGGDDCLRGALSRMEHCGPPIDRERQRVDDALRVTGALTDLILARSRDRVAGFLPQLRSLHPQATLARGYAVVEREGGVVRSVREVKAGDRLDIRVSDGAFPARVESKAGAGPRKARPQQPTQPSLFA